MAIPKPKHKSSTKLKKKCWEIFSRYIRMRDSIRTHGSITDGKCVTCGKLLPWKQMDAGHFIPRYYGTTLFDERNVHLQCKHCNSGDGEILKHRRAVVNLHGEGADVELEEKAGTKQWGIRELEEMIEYYGERIKQFEQGNWEIIWREN